MSAEVRPPEAELQALIAKAQGGDARALDRVVRMHMPLVAAQAKRYGRPSITEDLIQAGIAGPHDSRSGKGGLMLAIERFDAGRGVKFATHAVWWIRAAMESEVGLHGSIVQPHRRGREKRRKVRKVAAALEAVSGQAPTVAEVLEALPARQRKSVKRRGVELALEPLPRQQREIAGNGGSSERGGVSSCEDHSSPERLESPELQPDAALELRRLIAKLGAVLEDSLSAQELDIIRSYYGLREGRARGEECTLVELAARYGMPKSTMKEAHQRALAKLRAMIEASPAVIAAAWAALGFAIARGGHA